MCGSRVAWCIVDSLPIQWSNSVYARLTLYEYSGVQEDLALVVKGKNDDRSTDLVSQSGRKAYLVYAVLRGFPRM